MSDNREQYDTMSDAEREKLRREHIAAFEREKRSNPNNWDLSPPQLNVQPEYAQKKCWHPVMLEPEGPHHIEPDTGKKVKDHKLIILNMRHAMGLDKPKEESSERRQAAAKVIPEMLMYLCQSSVSNFRRDPTESELKQLRKVPGTI